MTYRTHILGGVLAALLVSKGLGIEEVEMVGVVGASAFSSLIPDIDHPGSKLGRKVPFVSKALSMITGHRGITHAPVLYGLIYMGLERTGIPPYMAIGLTVGALSHILLDMLNTGGVPLLLPVTAKRFSLLGIRTRSQSESVFFLGLVAAILGTVSSVI